MKKEIRKINSCTICLFHDESEYFCYYYKEFLNNVMKHGGCKVTRVIIELKE